MDKASTAELLQARLKDLDRYNAQIAIAEDALERKPALLIELNGLFRQLQEEEDMYGYKDHD